jgi:hypothetical protein
MMSGNIKEILLNSEAAKSLIMERDVANIFNNHSWPAEIGVYYADSETGKPREIDVYSKNTIDMRRKGKGVGAPIVNISIYCECKSLFGSNIIFSEGNPSKYFPDKTYDYWIGREGEIEDIIRTFTSALKLPGPVRLKKIYRYVMSRAYSEDGMALFAPSRMKPPPVQFIARSFRETKGGKDLREGTAETGRISPIWSAARSSLSAINAGLERSRIVGLDYVHLTNPDFHDIKEVISNTAFFLDAELTRACYFHPFIVVGSKLWKICDDTLEEIISSRLIITNMSGENDYVDIVNNDHKDEYISYMIKHFEKESKKHLSKIWSHIYDINWQPGQHKSKLSRACGISN